MRVRHISTTDHQQLAKKTAAARLVMKRSRQSTLPGTDETLEEIATRMILLELAKALDQQPPAGRDSGPATRQVAAPAAASSQGRASSTSSQALVPIKVAAADLARLAAAATGASNSAGGGSSGDSRGGGSQAAAAAAGSATGTSSTPESSSNPGSSSNSSSNHACRVCGSVTRHDGNAKLLRCTICKDKGCLYCSPACQKQDWPRHKQTCVPARSGPGVLGG
jgi:hypothetical protein